MKATQAFNSHFLPKKRLGNRTIRECSSSGKRENIVLIEVDCDDLGDVIILDVPESFQEKFKKNIDHDVIKIDDEDGGESGVPVCNMDIDHTNKNFSPTSEDPSSNLPNMDASANRGSHPASAACFSACPDVDEDCIFVNTGATPVTLSKSKRTYSGKTVSRNRYGLSSDPESSSDSECSDCEVVEGSPGKLREQWEKASYNRRRETNYPHNDAVNEAGTSAANQSVHYSNEESSGGLSESVSYECSSINGQNRAEDKKFFQTDSNDSDDISSGGYFTCNDYNNFKNGSDTSIPGQPVNNGSRQTVGEHTKLPNEESCFKSSINYDRHGHFHDSLDQVPKRSKSPQQNYDPEKMDKLFKADFSNDVTKGTPYQDFEFDNLASTCKEQVVAGSTLASNNSSFAHDSESKYSLDQNNILTDRQKIKETDEYKRAMEEEWASRQQQLQRQAEEAQRLRSRKRAEKLRIFDNERRQKQRLEEIRETRRKDEEHLNLKEKLRVEIKKELRRLENICVDMASLLRCLGIHIGPFPSANEVQAAYKRACLKFHPDRLSTNDLRQQVEAEEKFKLISNMKEKFLK